jgi:hypothetical protein
VLSMVSRNVPHNSSRYAELYKLNVNLGATVMKRPFDHMVILCTWSSVR